ncbi:hypothetical protein HK101_004772 [Irineochytrium annulatum]|nr:hypothetical protein HK101_004772 [Irineochytrium annulatum]
MVGDSNDRNVVETNCDFIEGAIHNVDVEGEEIPDWDVKKGDIRLCVFRPGASPKWVKEKEEAVAKKKETVAKEVDEETKVSAAGGLFELMKQLRAQKKASKAKDVVKVGLPAKEPPSLDFLPKDPTVDADANAPTTASTSTVSSLSPEFSSSSTIALPTLSSLHSTFLTAASFSAEPVSTPALIHPRSSASTSDQVFVILFVFNYGISLEDGDTRDHIRPGLDPAFPAIVATIPRLINLLAAKHFPSLIDRDLERRNAHLRIDGEQEIPTVTPSLIVSQSSLWEVIAWQNGITKNVIFKGGEDAIVEAGMAVGFKRLERDISRTWLGAFERHFTGVPLAWRNCPPARMTYKFPHVIVAYNSFVREVIRGLEGRVRWLDWNRLVDGRDWLWDHIHQNDFGEHLYFNTPYLGSFNLPATGQLAFGQMLLTEMEYQLYLSSRKR